MTKKILVFCLRNTLTKSFELFQNSIGCCGQTKRLSIGIVVLHEPFDFRNQDFNTFEGPPTNGFLSNEVKPDLDPIGQRGISRCTVTLG